jgi:ABC-type sugar transport system substrate-binding protein
MRLPQQFSPKTHMPGFVGMSQSIVVNFRESAVAAVERRDWQYFSLCQAAFYGPAAANLNERVEGVREVLGKAGWKEASGSPTFCNDDPMLAVQHLNDLATAHGDLNAVIPVGG